jgi:hypothetical protein
MQGGLPIEMPRPKEYREDWRAELINGGVALSDPPPRGSRLIDIRFGFKRVGTRNNGPAHPVQPRDTPEH